MKDRIKKRHLKSRNKTLNDIKHNHDILNKLDKIRGGILVNKSLAYTDDPNHWFEIYDYLIRDNKYTRVISECYREYGHIRKYTTFEI